MNRNLNRRINPIAEADGLSPKKLVKVTIWAYMINVKTLPMLMQMLCWIGKKKQFCHNITIFV